MDISAHLQGVDITYKYKRIFTGLIITFVSMSFCVGSSTVHESPRQRFSSCRPSIICFSGFTSNSKFRKHNAPIAQTDLEVSDDEHDKDEAS